MGRWLIYIAIYIPFNPSVFAQSETPTKSAFQCITTDGRDLHFHDGVDLGQTMHELLSSCMADGSMPVACATQAACKENIPADKVRFECAFGDHLGEGSSLASAISGAKYDCLLTGHGRDCVAAAVRVSCIEK